MADDHEVQTVAGSTPGPEFRQADGALADGLAAFDAVLEDDFRGSPAEHNHLLAGCRALRDGDPAGALQQLRRASRLAPAPLDAVARCAAAECHRSLGRTQAARRQWEQLLDTSSTPPAVGLMACLSLAGLAEDVGDPELLARTRRMLRCRFSTLLASLDSTRTTPSID